MYLFSCLRHVWNFIVMKISLNVLYMYLCMHINFNYFCMVDFFFWSPPMQQSTICLFGWKWPFHLCLCSKRRQGHVVFLHVDPCVPANSLLRFLFTGCYLPNSTTKPQFISRDASLLPAAFFVVYRFFSGEVYYLSIFFAYLAYTTMSKLKENPG